MSCQNLHIGSRKVRLQADVTITVSKCYTLHEVIIDVRGQSDKKVKKNGRKCFCNCNFSIGQIVEKYQISLPPDNAYDDERYDHPIYDVECCTEEQGYILYKYLLPTDFCDYPLAAPVIVAAYNQMDFTMCPQHSSRRKGVVSGCRPMLHPITTKLQQGSYLSVEKLRKLSGSFSTYRILPLCAAEMKKMDCL